VAPRPLLTAPRASETIQKMEKSKMEVQRQEEDARKKEEEKKAPPKPKVPQYIPPAPGSLMAPFGSSSGATKPAANPAATGGHGPLPDNF